MVAYKCRCRFKECPNELESNGTCYLKPGGFCFTYFEEISDDNYRTFSIEKRYGCFEPGDGTLMQCKGHLSSHNVMKNISCCNQNDYCNDHLFTHINDGEIIHQEHYSINELVLFPWIYIVLAFIFMVICLSIIIRIKYHLMKKKSKELQKNDSFSDKLLLPQPINAAKTFAPYLNYGNMNNIFDLSGGSSGISSATSASLPKYALINASHNLSNYTLESNLPSYQCLSSGTSNTASSFMSENTQQTIVSSQKSQGCATMSSSLPPVNEDSITSGSGSGVPRMVQTTIAMQIELKRLIGEGRFGRVYHGVRHCEHYAVKIYNSIYEAYWSREVHIYQGTIMRHENIVTFLAADIISINACTQLWLVTEYHELGSLYDFLNRNSIQNFDQMIKIMRSIIFGLSHLHVQVIGTKGKPSIAHRDIKSKNIMMKSFNTCCISDFASSLINTTNNKANISDAFDINNFGTIRYMAPEILDRNINRFEDFICADIYSLGLVYWEIFNCLQINAENAINCGYKKPYQEYLSDEPTIDEMNKIVCVDKKRPTIRNDLKMMPNSIISNIIKLIDECLYENRFARLTSLHVKKIIINLEHDIQQQQQKQQP